MSARSIFVTGTDTEIGKTRVATALLRAAARRGLRVAGYKPVSAGAEVVAGELRNEDGEALLAASNIELSYAEVNPVVLPEAIAPHIAAANAGVEIDREALLQGWQRLAARADLVVVEGAGGWCVPLGTDWGFRDLVRAAGWPVVLVVGMRLGCLNHAQLSAEAIATGAQLDGWIANCLPPGQPMLAQNIETLQQWLPAPCLGQMAAHADALELTPQGQNWLERH